MRRILTAMTFILILAALFIALPLLATRFGADSRGLRDHDWEVTWDRMPHDAR